MSYINDTTKEQKQYSELQAEYPNSSIPKNGIAVIGGLWFFINVAQPPEYNIHTEKAVEIEPAKVGDIYSQTWEIQSLTQEEIDSNIELVKDDKYIEVDDYAKAQIEIGYGNPKEGYFRDPQKWLYEMQRLTKRLTNALTQEKAIPAQYINQSIAFDVLVNYEYNTMIQSDDAYALIEAAITADEVLAIDISTVVPWPTWTPPV